MHPISLMTGSSILVSGLGLILIIRIWAIWRHLDRDVLKAKVFLDKTFLVRNWISVFLAGAFITTHEFSQYLLEEYYPDNILLSLFSEIFALFSITVLVVLAYQWYVLISPKDLK